MKQTISKTAGIGILFLMFGTTLTSKAQEAAESKNIVKINVPALFLKNYSFQYERAIGEKMSIGGGIKFSPKSSVPLKSRLESLIDDEEAWESISQFKTGNFAITPELRFYLGKKVFQGFYIAPYARFATYTAEVPFKFDVDVMGTTYTETMPLSGDITTLSGGILLGSQFKIAKRLHLDWWILGAHYGTSSGNISGTKTLSNEEQQALREQLAELEDLPLVKTKYTVDGNGAKVDFDGPWAGLRAGLSVGFRF
ncbi:DUF3575 domain-containing protein [Pedobacter deserti]|uniref:DUF3575 domain-containing protein n=1 Tax=Pedobacter deserti TaxID=2817382 RepID=UPI00210D82C9|nr:DUF3575 domain-containing protein [Pedobacter sp. SYSU D00382]